ncbi:hypothetical protein phiAS5_ORF0197 [Aeromonas phage phiAS5]|uniref:Mannose-1-phosphate guanyltransferase C-terminal domain-containing protein n=1 Tax=Aeromonas phage phiAS5 TaxID=879630 RepID=E1A2U4_9CAUD|nr:hypothetical protein phiAS5_ORF0197 [Aeromonas phage phiAS5]ADM80040.1 hypothetical protein phiAS5_ORF0197 [Aeromonas phage phiAS5]
MEYWKINDQGRLEALVDFPAMCRFQIIDVKAGDVGAVIPASCHLPKTTEIFWVHHDAVIGGSVLFGEDVYIGKGSVIGGCVTIRRGTKIDSKVNIQDDVEIGECVTIHNNTKIYYASRIRRYVIIGPSVIIRRGVRIDERTIINQRSYIGMDSRISSQCIISNDCIIGDKVSIHEFSTIRSYSKIENCVLIGNNSTIGDRCVIGERVNLANKTIIHECNNIVLGSYHQLVGMGGKSRTITMYIRDRKVVINVGCQRQIGLGEFKARVRDATGTGTDSTDVYKKQMPMIEAAYGVLEAQLKIGIKEKIKNFFKK